MSIKDKLEEWWIASEFAMSKNQFIAVLVLAGLIAGGWLFYYFLEPSNSIPIKVSKNSAPPKTNVSVSRSVAKIFVHVAGAVKKPGVYKIGEGSRVIEAVNLAGGFAKEADKDSLNLAAKVVDSQKITVALKSKAVSGQKATSSSEDLVNLNTADAEQLDELPGIGETMAKRILEYRQEKGSFSSIDELKEIEGIGDKKFEKLKEKVIL
jgi:competence protein ComEA